MAYDWSRPVNKAYKRLGESHIFIGNDDSYLSTLNTQATDTILATGFHPATSDVQGQYVSIRRNGFPALSTADHHSENYAVTKLRLFQSQNLLQVAGIVASITSDTVPVSSLDS